MYVNVTLNIPAHKLFTYEVPPSLRQEVEIGKRVFIPFGRRKRTGFIIAMNATCNLTNVKSILEILDDEALFGKADLDFYQWIANYFLYPLGKTLAELIPAGSEKKDFLWITPVSLPADISLPPLQEKLLAFLQQYPQGIAFSNLLKIYKLKNISSAVRSLHLAGLLKVEEKQNKQLAVRNEKIAVLDESEIAGTKLTVKQKLLIEFLKTHGPTALTDLMKKAKVSSAVVNNLHNKKIISFTSAEKIRTVSLHSVINSSEGNITLNDEQKMALTEIFRYLGKNVFAPILLHGITGSGKTEVYLNAIEDVLKNGGAAIYLVADPVAQADPFRPGAAITGECHGQRYPAQQRRRCAERVSRSCPAQRATMADNRSSPRAANPQLIRTRGKT